MTIRYVDGFDQYNSFANLQRQYPAAVTTGKTYTTTTPYARGKAITSAVTSEAQGLTRTLNDSIPQGTYAYQRCHVMITTMPTSNNTRLLFGFGEGSFFHTSLYINTNGYLQAYRGSGSTFGSTLIGQGSNRQMILNQWYSVECRIKLDTTTAGLAGDMEVRVDGVVWMTLTGIQLRNASGVNGVIDVVSLIKEDGGAGGVVVVDNWVVWDGAGSINNSWLGDIEVQTLFPSADNVVTGWTPNTGTAWQAIDDGATGEDGDTTYIAGSTLASPASFALTDLAGSPVSVLAVEVMTIARKDDAGARSIKSGVLSTAAVAESPHQVLTTVYAGLTHVIELDPDGNIAWTPTKVNALKSRVDVSV